MKRISILILLLCSFASFAATDHRKSKYPAAWYDSSNETVHATIAAFDSAAVVLNKTTSGKWYLQIYDLTGNVIFEIDTTGAAIRSYAEMFFADSSVDISVSASDTWYQVTNVTDNLFASGTLKNFSYSGDSLTCNLAGKYKVSGDATITGGSGFRASIKVNGTVNDSTIITLSNSDVITMWVKNTYDSTNPTFRKANLILQYLHK